MVAWTVSDNVGQRSGRDMSEFEIRRENSGLISRLEFAATLQLRTPLRVLWRHGELHTDPDAPPPQIIREPWEGMWMVKTKTWRELGGADIPDFHSTELASDIGPVPNDGRFLEFLITVRVIVEATDPINLRTHRLRRELLRDEWRDFVERYGGGCIERGSDTIMGRLLLE